ncbi:hypothetical protein E9993_17345 [Labilibacter sediminis]|nr:hypothetical protein E9993_17345 [Labilibacter sediminis]
MKKLIKILHAFVAIIFMLQFISCQKEYIDIVEPDKNVTISADDNIADLILKVSLKDGSYDNIIDKCSEISINYPYAIHIDDELLYINSIDEIETIKYNYYQYLDDIEISYPVTISFSNYSKMLLLNEDQLEEIQEQYHSTFTDDDIECIDFVYPIELSVYNNVKESIDVSIVNNDYEMYNVFDNINSLLVDISFPIELKLSSGQIVSVSNNNQLEDEITKVNDVCDEDDETEFDDDDYPYEELIIQNTWQVLSYNDANNNTSHFSSYILSFNQDNTIQVTSDKGTFKGTWELNVKAQSLKIEFETDDPPLSLLNENWKIVNSNLIIIELITEKDIKGFNKKLILQNLNKKQKLLGDKF